MNTVGKPEEAALVTEDKWMREAGGLIDFTDRQILNEASGNGCRRVRVITIRQMLELMSQTEPGKYRRFRKEMERQASRSLTFDELVELGRKGNERLEEFTGLIGGSITLAQASQVRIWRVEHRMTWRSVARAAFNENWFNRAWQPPSNQLMGIALCKKAAAFFRENYRAEPWN